MTVVAIIYLFLLKDITESNQTEEDISNTRDSVSSVIRTPRIESKILRCSSYFQLSSHFEEYASETLSLVFDILYAYSGAEKTRGLHLPYFSAVLLKH